MQISFGDIGVCVEGYTLESLYDFLVEHELDDLLYKRNLDEHIPFTENTFLQSLAHGQFSEGTSISVHEGFVHYVLDMENFMLILRVGILDPDAANSLVDELYSQGLIKPRKEL